MDYVATLIGGGTLIVGFLAGYLAKSISRLIEAKATRIGAEVPCAYRLQLLQQWLAWSEDTLMTGDDQEFAALRARTRRHVRVEGDK